MNYSNTYANPFNWTGSKFRYLKNFLSVLPKEDNLKVLDCFLGGGDLISKLPEDWVVKGVDVIRPLIGLHTSIQNREITVEKVVTEFESRGMSKINQEAYLKLRQEYNTQPTPEKLYLLMTNSFNNQMRFNSKGEFNMPFGKTVVVLIKVCSQNLLTTRGLYQQGTSLSSVNLTKTKI